MKIILNKNIQFVLVEPSHPGNIGAVARAISTMGYDQLALVKPKEHPHPESRARSSSALDVLLNAGVYDELEDEQIGWRPTMYNQPGKHGILSGYDEMDNEVGLSRRAGGGCCKCPGRPFSRVCCSCPIVGFPRNNIKNHFNILNLFK